MALKVFFCDLIDFGCNLNVAYSFGFLFLVLSFLVSNVVRTKLFFFLLLLIYISIWGFSYSLDGFFLILLNIELSLVLYCLVLYTQIYYRILSGDTQLKKQAMFSIFCFCCCLLFVNSQGFGSYSLKYNFQDFYANCKHVVSSDFFILYNFFFVKNIHLVIFFVIFLSIFSFFFILLYYFFKSQKEVAVSKQKKITFLRKQITINQSNFITNVKLFSKKKK